MAITKCKECGKEISNKAKACVNCGAQIKSTSVIRSIFRFLVIVFIIIPIGISIFFTVYVNEKNTGNNTLSSTQENEIKKPADNLAMSFKPIKTGFGNVMQIDISIKNNNTYKIKDITIKCTNYGKSGTKLDTNERTIYDVVEAGQTKQFNKFNMGFINTQTDSSSCEVKAAVKA